MLIVSLLSTALVGLISLQGYLLYVSYEQKEQAFDRSVMNALNAVAHQIEKEEAASKIFTVAAQLAVPPKVMKTAQRKIRKDSSHPQQTFSWIITDTVKSGNGRMRVEVFHSEGIDTMTTFMVQGSTGSNSRRTSEGYSYSTDNNGVRIRTSMSESTLVLFRDTTRKRRGEIVSQVVDKLFLLETLPIAQRIDRINVDSLISVNLAAVGIAVPFSFRIDGEHDDTTVSAETSMTPYTARLFPSDLISEKHELLLFLPDKAAFVRNQMTVLLTLSLIFISVIVFSFVFSVRAIFRQQRLAGSIMDFINNMTHEFKTPISTIALAAEAIARPDTFRNKKKLQQYTSVIADENVRMKRQVDTILQMAVLEEGEFELKRSSVDLHEIIRLAVKNISLPIEAKHGTVSAELTAPQPVVEGDIVHLTNIIHNVLDNANKYSPYTPSIVISTANVKGMCSITVRDNGVGIDKEYLHRVFDKYYRVPTGNTHDVKGFGLGLSYVKLIAEAHGGSVFITSEWGKGTIVEIHLPLQSNAKTPLNNNN